MSGSYRHALQRQAEDERRRADAEPVAEGAGYFGERGHDP